MPAGLRVSPNEVFDEGFEAGPAREHGAAVRQAMILILAGQV